MSELLARRIERELGARCPGAPAEVISITAETAVVLADVGSRKRWRGRPGAVQSYLKLTDSLVRFLHHLGPTRVAGSSAEGIMGRALVLADELLADTLPVGEA